MKINFRKPKKKRLYEICPGYYITSGEGKDLYLVTCDKTASDGTILIGAVDMTNGSYVMFSEKSVWYELKNVSFNFSPDNDHEEKQIPVQPAMIIKAGGDPEPCITVRDDIRTGDDTQYAYGIYSGRRQEFTYGAKVTIYTDIEAFV